MIGSVPKVVEKGIGRFAPSKCILSCLHPVKHLSIKGKHTPPKGTIPRTPWGSKDWLVRGSQLHSSGFPKSKVIKRAPKWRLTDKYQEISIGGKSDEG